MIPIDLGTISFFFQSAQPLIYAETLRLNTKIREDASRNSLLITEMNHEQQLKMFHLAEFYKTQEKWIDHQNKKELMHEQSALQAHNKKMDLCDEYYKMGDFIKSRLGNKPAPFIIVSTNPYQKYNPFKNEAHVIAPLNRITNTIRQLNGIYEDKKLLSIIDTNEFFMSEGDVSSFFHRELNCPCIIIYANFTGESLSINSFVAGVLDSQRNSISTIGKNDLNPKRELLWDIPYSFIYELIAAYNDKNKPHQWTSHLAEFTNLLVVLNIQRYLDEYFKYYPQHIYNSQTIDFIKTKEEISTQLKLDDTLLKSVEDLNVITNEFQRTLWPSSKVEFINIKSLELESEINIKLSVAQQSNYRNELLTVISKNKKPKFSCEIFAIPNNENKFAVIDLNGNLISKFEFDNIKIASENHFAAEQNGKWGVLNKDCKVVVPFIYENAESPHNDYIKIKDKRGWGIITTSLVEKITPAFKEIAIRENNVFLGERIGYTGERLFDSNGSFLDYQPVLYESGDYFLLAESYNDRDVLNDVADFFNIENSYSSGYHYYLYDTSTKTKHKVYSLQESKLDYIIEYESGHIDIFIPNKKRYENYWTSNFILDNTKFGKIKLENSSGRTCRPTELRKEESSKYVICLVGEDVQVKIIDDEKRNKLKGLKIQKSLPFVNEIAAIQMNNLWGFLNMQIDVIVQPIFDEVNPFFNGIAAVRKNNFWGYIDVKGKYIYEPIFTEITNFNENRAFVKFPGFINNEWAVIDNQGNILTNKN